MTKCPECKSALRVGVIRCACGWKDMAASARITQSDNLAAERLRDEARASDERWRAAGRPTAAESIARMHFIQKQPKPTATEHWKRVAAMKNPPAMAYQHAIDYLTRIGEYVEREPGQDDDQQEAA